MQKIATVIHNIWFQMSIYPEPFGLIDWLYYKQISKLNSSDKYSLIKICNLSVLHIGIPSKISFENKKKAKIILKPQQKPKGNRVVECLCLYIYVHVLITRSTQPFKYIRPILCGIRWSEG